MFLLDQTIKDRHSTRKFLSKPVPRILLNEALALAQLAPSNSNTQPWRVVFAFMYSPRSTENGFAKASSAF